MSFIKQSTTVFAFATLAMIGVDAAAATARVTCEVSPTRSKISVDGKSLAAGNYTAVAMSGGNVATSPAQAAVAGEIETDFDSKPADINAGAVAIVPTFIVGGKVTGKIVNASGAQVASGTAFCRVRSK